MKVVLTPSFDESKWNLRIVVINELHTIILKHHYLLKVSKVSQKRSNWIDSYG